MCRSEDSHPAGFRSAGWIQSHFIGFVLLQYGEYGVYQLSGHSADSRTVGLSFASFLFVERLEHRIEPCSNHGRHPDGPSKIRRASFGEPVVGP